jgi:hypothetical protein
MEKTIQLNADGSTVTTVTESDLHSVQIEIGAKREIKPTVKFYFSQPEEAEKVAQQALELCRTILAQWNPGPTFSGIKE